MLDHTPLRLRGWAFLAFLSVLIVSFLAAFGLESAHAYEYPETPDDTAIDDTIAWLEEDGWITYKYWKVHDPNYTNDYRLIIIYYQEWSTKATMPEFINAQDRAYSPSYGKFVASSFEDTIYQSDTGSFTYDTREEEFALFTEKVTEHIGYMGYVDGWPVPPDDNDKQVEDEDGDEDKDKDKEAGAGDEDKAGGNGSTTSGGATDGQTPEGDRETWWGSIVTILVGITALIAASGPFLSTLLSRGLPAIAAQVGTTPGGAPPLDALGGDLPYRPLTDGAVLSNAVAGQKNPSFVSIADKYLELKKSIPSGRSPAFDRVWEDYVNGNIGEDKVEIIADLLENETIPLDKINEGYDSFLKWESSRMDKAGRVMKTAVTDLVKSKLDPLGFMEGKIADEAERIGSVLKDAKLLQATKLFGKWTLIGDIQEYTKFAIKSYEASGYMMQGTDYPHFDAFLKHMDVSSGEIPGKLATTRSQIEKYSEKLAEQLERQKEATLSMTDGDTAEGARINEKLRGDLERIDRMVETYENILDDLRVEERVYMVRSKGADAPVIKSVKPGDWFVRPDIDGIEKF